MPALRVARSHSLFMPVMEVSGMPLGQAVAHAGEGAAAEALLVHLRHHVQHPGLPLGAPCGSTFRWLILAEVNSIAAPLGQAATQAPQPMHSACSKAKSASGLGTGVACASGRRRWAR